MPLQPFLHDLLATVAAPSQLWTDRSGQIRPGGLAGFYHGDHRALSRLEFAVEGQPLEVLSCAGLGLGSSVAEYAVRSIDGPGPDPTTALRRTARVQPGLLEVELTVSSATDQPVNGRLEAILASDGAQLEVVKQGFEVPPPADFQEAGTIAVARPCGPEGLAVSVSAPSATVVATAGEARLIWQVECQPGSTQTLRFTVQTEDSSAVVRPAVRSEPEWNRPTVRADDPRLARVISRSLDDLAGLRMTWAQAPNEVFLAAGAPWFFTLFGRDSIWAARLLLPLGTDLARGTLRTLAAGQGQRVDPVTAEQPGKILHEVRSAPLEMSDGTTLPPIYYGTVDATPLWICLLHDAWRWGMNLSEVADLVPNLERALDWLADFADGDGDGFLDYIDASGSGLSNQGWKDSGDSIRWRDGSLAEGPIALSEVQAYAYEAAIGGADLLDALGRPGGDRWRAWAADLSARFRERFWTEDEYGPYLGIALDRHGKLVDSVASNMGHVIGTGILTPEEESVVAQRLISPELSSGYGLRTLSDRMSGFWPLGYHRGSVWPHDTAIAIHGLLRAGLCAEADLLATGLLDAAESVDFQFPELFGGATSATTPGVVPYPASCHPQAWSAASAVTMAQAALRLTSGPEGPVVARTAVASPVGAVALDGVACAGGTWRVEVDADGTGKVTPLR